ncbi:MAG: hypothetical protein RMZ41_007220 [Nostoc sp. DedVER02]|uniref:hypothetical protein n=1 Tax=unclassified Nostoc TaxID=2593658 RepID=UPI002AD21BE3|nr:MULTISPECIES: hypothetical protein [unclassified Nostoc]MDZ7985505.1 hypothetical protein [Nostoc sp. DedVER02]MDZ8116971.1 hypothetical protein [Nostoc sp. DedVER01b]
MQNIQSPLGNNIHPLGVISFLSNPQRMILRKASHSLHSQNNFISTIQTKPPLVTSSKFFLSHQYEPSIQPLIGWDSWDTEDISSEFPLIDFDASDSIATLENSNESVKNSIPEITPTPTEVNTSNDTSQEVDIKIKSKSKKTNKSQQLSEKKSTSKSRTKKSSKSSTAKNVKQVVDKNNASINAKKNKSLTSDESLPLETNLETPNLQLDIASDISAKEHSYVSNITADTSPSFQNQSNLFRNITNDGLSVNSELISSLPNTDLPLIENNFTSQENIELENENNELINSSYIELPSKNNIEEILIPNTNFTNTEEKLIPEISESVKLSGMPVSQTPSQQNIEIDRFSSITDNRNSVIQTNLIQTKEILTTLISPSQEAESPNTNTNFEAITAIEPDLISEKSTNNFVTDNAVYDNSSTLFSELNSSKVDDAPTLLHSLENDENTVEAHVALPNSESSVAKNPITVQQEIAPDFSHHLEKTTQDISLQPPLLPEKGENLKPLSLQRKGFLDSVKSQEIDSIITSESLDSAPVQLTHTSAEIEDTPSLFGNPVASELQSAIAVNVSDISANVAPLQRDSNVENTTSELTENYPIFASPEIAETPIITATSPEIGKASVVSVSSDEISETLAITTILPKIGEASTITATLPEIGESPTITATSPEIGESPTITAISPEINEALVVSASPPEISETPGITTILPKIGESPTITATSPEINEALVVSASSPEISEAPTITATSPEIGEASVVSASSPEITETPIISAISPEIAEASTITATSPEIAEEASIFRKIIESEQTVESENPEISAFTDTWDNPEILENPTFPQDEVSTAPKVEQNLPAPKGYATGGHVTNSHVDNRQYIAPSDTIPAMLTPGEFVINTRDAQKNLPLLHHINTGGTPHDIILPSLQTPNPIEPEETISPETPTKVDSFSDTSLQLKSAETDSPEISNSLIPPSLGLNISQNKLSVLNSPQLNPLQNETINVGEASPQYSSPPLVFRKANPTTNTSSQWSNTPSQWSSVEDLLNGNNDDFTSFNFNDEESNNQNYEFSHGSESPQVFAKHLPAPRGFANGGEVTLPDISREIQPITETIESAPASSEGDEKDDTANLEALAREIYHRLRQRIEIERERHGGYSGRLPW